MENTIPLTHLPAALIEAGYNDAPSYRACYNHVLNAKLPAKQNRAGRWFVNLEDLPAIVEALGLGESLAA